MDQADTPLSEQARAILQLIAAGRSYDQILLRFPDLTYQDIFEAAQEALAKLPASALDAPASQPAAQIEPEAASQAAPGTAAPARTAERLPTFIERARQTHHRAWARWTPDEDVQLERLFRRGAHLAEMGQALGRHNGAIRSRLLKLGLVTEGEDEPELLLKPADAPPAPNAPASAPPPRASSTWDGGWDVIRRRLEGQQDRD